MSCAEGLCVASSPPLQVAAGGEVVPGGVDLVGVAADVVVQLEIRIVRGNSEVLPVSAGYRSSMSGKSARVSCW